MKVMMTAPIGDVLVACALPASQLVPPDGVLPLQPLQRAIDGGLAHPVAVLMEVLQKLFGRHMALGMVFEVLQNLFPLPGGIFASHGVSTPISTKYET